MLRLPALEFEVEEYDMRPVDVMIREKIANTEMKVSSSPSGIILVACRAFRSINFGVENTPAMVDRRRILVVKIWFRRVEVGDDVGTIRRIHSEMQRRIWPT